MTTHLFCHDPSVPAPFAQQSWLSLWPVFLSEDTVIVLDPADALPLVSARPPVTRVTGNVDGTPFSGVGQALNRGTQLAEQEAEWFCVWRSEYLYPRAYHAVLQDAQAGANLILPYETFHGVHYCDAKWCQANGEAILCADEDELLKHCVVAPVYQTRSFSHFAIRADFWRQTGGFDARLHTERAAVAEWTHRACCDPACRPACRADMIAFRQNIRRRIEIRPDARQNAQAEQELQTAHLSPELAHALVHDDLEPLCPLRPGACYQSFPRPTQSLRAAPTNAGVHSAILEYAHEMLRDLALPQAVDAAAFMTQVDGKCAEAYYILGAAWYAQGRRFEAVRAIMKSVMLERGCRKYVWELLTLWRDLYCLEDGKQMAAQLLELYGDEADMVDMAHWFVAQWERQQNSTALRRVFAPGSLVFDVGAHYAVKAQEMLRQGAGALVCFDCQPNCVAALQEKYKDAKNVVVMPYGLADKPGSIEFSICGAGEGISTFSTVWKTGRFRDMTWDRTIRAPVTTLDLMIAQFGRPAYCKIDVEGFELNVLHGLTQPIPCLSFEFAKEFIAQTRLCVEYLAALGFEAFNVMIGNDERLLFGQHTSSERLLTALEQSPDQLLWGDIFAFCSHAISDAPDLKRLAAARRLTPEDTRSPLPTAA